MPRHKEPAKVTAWYRGAPGQIPKCCHTCEHYNQYGNCEIYAMQPPADFAEAEDQCEAWIQEIPF